MIPLGDVSSCLYHGSREKWEDVDFYGERRESVNDSLSLCPL